MVVNTITPAVVIYLPPYYKQDGRRQKDVLAAQGIRNPKLRTCAGRGYKRGTTLKHVAAARMRPTRKMMLSCTADRFGRHVGFFYISATSHDKYRDAQHHAVREPRQRIHCIRTQLQVQCIALCNLLSNEYTITFRSDNLFEHESYILYIFIAKDIFSVDMQNELCCGLHKQTWKGKTMQVKSARDLEKVACILNNALNLSTKIACCSRTDTGTLYLKQSSAWHL